MSEESTKSQSEKLWWEGAALYQIYPRSFFDTTGSGVGDLKGICSKLDYIKSLNVSGIWISPFYKSPMVDFGYDVSDYKNVDPLFGNIDDLKKLLVEAHNKNLKVIVDLVLSHTSQEHEWFINSVENPDGPYGDYYVWKETDNPNELPNNWLSVFGGPAWTYHPKRKAFYFHNFLKEQPDLNLHNPKVVEELLDVAKFWLDLGVDGFRLDACNCYYHDQSLKDNPKGPSSDVKVQDEENPYFSMVHLYDKSQPENIKFLSQLREVTDSYKTSHGKDILLLGEIFCDREEETTRSYTSEGKPLQSAYNFSLLTNERVSGMVRDAVMTYYSISSMTAWSFSNHDVVRVVSRWGDGLTLENRAKAYNTLLSGLPGICIFYQGEELGLTETVLSKEFQFDPFGSNIDSPYPGRDGCRTPLPWSQEENNFGFTTGKPWLPLAPDHKNLAVNSQEMDKNSVLNATRRLLEFRKSNPLLKSAGLHFWEDDGNAIVYARPGEKETFVFMANFGSTSLKWEGLGPGELMTNLSEKIEFFETEQGYCLELLTGGFGVLVLHN